MPRKGSLRPKILFLSTFVWCLLLDFRELETNMELMPFRVYSSKIPSGHRRGQAGAPTCLRKRSAWGPSWGSASRTNCITSSTVHEEGSRPLSREASRLSRYRSDPAGQEGTCCNDGDWFVTPHHSPRHVPMALWVRLRAAPEWSRVRGSQGGEGFSTKGLRLFLSQIFVL